MSADDFDPVIERLFARAPEFNDSALFNARVLKRLDKSSRVRSVALGAAGMIGGVVAVNEMVGVNLTLGQGSLTAESGRSMPDGVSDTAREGGLALQALADSVGLGSFDYGSLGQTQIFLVAAGLIMALLTVGAIKLYQHV
ncbi:hypothetical protein [Brevundimonas vesicularis]|uniref:hypothetical protein n=1 Tax=Brevundimonas vesicularis TaxID=41276 RepID=UPI0038D3C0AA